MSTLLLDRLIHGYEEIEPVILGLMAMDKSFMLIGRHGTGKTKLAKWLSHGFGNDSFVFYDATKDDLISIAGIPDPESLKIGKLKFAGHERSIWDKTVIVVDEITRAAKENQNLWLEILEERTCFGIPLKYKSIIATANPESYAAAFQLDEALLDRFYAVVSVPEMQSGLDSHDIKMMVSLSMSDGGAVNHEEISRIFSEIRTAHDSLIREKAMDIVSAYLGEIIPSVLNMLQEQNGVYVSPRTYCHMLPEAIVAIAAYYKVAGSEEPLIAGAVQALRYSVATKLQTNPLALEQHHRAASVLLKGGIVSDAEKLRLELNSCKDTGMLLGFISKNWKGMLSGFTDDEREKSIRRIYQEIIKSRNIAGFLRLRNILIDIHYNGDTLRQLKGHIGTLMFKARRKLLPTIQNYLLAQTGHEHIPEDTARFLEMVASRLKDSQTSAIPVSVINDIEDFILMMSEKYEKPTIGHILEELKTMERMAILKNDKN